MRLTAILRSLLARSGRASGQTSPESDRGHPTAFRAAHPRAPIAAFELLESRQMLDAVAWTGAAGDNLWHTAGNWSNNAVPTIADDVTIAVTDADPTILFNSASGSRAVRSLNSTERVRFTGGTLQIATTADFFSALELAGGTLGGGSVTLHAEQSFTSGTLDGVTINGDFKVAGNQSISLLNGLTLNGTATVGDGTGYGVLQFSGSQTIGGTGSVVFGSNSNVNSLVMLSSGGTLTIGSGITVRGQRGYLGYNPNWGGASNSVVFPLGGIEWGPSSNINVDRARNYTITALEGATLAGQTLDGVTINGDFRVVGNGSVTVVNGVTLNGTATMGDGTGYGVLQFSGSQTIDGTGSVVFGSSSNVNSLVMLSSDGTLTIGSGITVRGQRGYLGYNPNWGGASNAVVVNNGTIQWTSGTNITVPSTLANSGSITVDSAGVLNTGGRIAGGTITTTTGAQIVAVTLDGVTINGDFRVASNGSVTVVNGVTLNGTATVGDGTGYGVLQFSGSQTIGGTGSVVFGSNSNVNSLVMLSSGGTLTIGSGITVRGQRGYLGYNPNWGGASNAVVVNNGTIQADLNEGIININGASLQSPGPLRATSGNIVSVVASVANSGNTLNLSGGGTIAFSGTVIGGAIAIAPGTSFSPYGGTLNGVTINGDFRVASNGSVTVVNGVTLNGTATVGDGTGYGVLQFSGSQTIGGTGSVVFGSSSNVNSLVMLSSGGTLTIGSGITVRGQRGYLGYNPNWGGASNSFVANNGTIQADVNGGTININGGGFQNTAAIKAFNGGTIAINGNVAGSRSSGTLDAAAGSTITVNAVITNTSNTMAFSGAGSLNLGGTTTNGIISITSGTLLNMSGTLDGVTINGDFRVVGNGSVTVVNGVTLNGTATVGDGTGYGVLQFSGSQTIGGTGSVVFGSSSNVNSLVMLSSGGTLTIGSGITVRGQRGYLGYNPNWGGASSAVVVNNGTIQWTSGTNITVPSRLNNNGAMSVDAAGVLSIGGTVAGGTITTTMGAQIAGGTLDGVTINGDFRVASNGSVTVVNGVTINGTATVGDGTGYGVLQFSGSQNIGGTGSVVFGSSSNVNSLVMLSSGGTLTIGSGITVRGQRGYLGYNPSWGGASNAVVVNNGTIQWTSGTNITVPSTLANSGSITVDSAGVLNTGGRIAGGTITTTAGATISGGVILSSVTIDGDFSVNGNSYFTVFDGLTLTGVATIGDSTGYGYINFNNVQTLSGTGSVNFGTSDGRNGLYVNFTEGPLTLASTLTIRGRSGTIGYNPALGGSSSAAVVNNGTIQANVSGGRIDVRGSSFQNAGAIMAVNGGRLEVSVSGANSRSWGTIDAAVDSSIFLVGSFSNANNNMSFSGLGLLSLGGATTSGGIISVAEGSVLSLGSGTLSGVTIDGHVIVFSNNRVVVTNGLTLNGRMTIGYSLRPAEWGSLEFSGTQTLSGDGSVIFDSGNNSNSLLMTTGAGTLTIGSGITISGKRGTIGYNPSIGGPSNVSVVNNGTILTDSSASDIRVLGTGTSFINNGNIIVSQGAFFVSVGGPIVNQGQLSIGPSGEMIAGAGFTQVSTGTLRTVIAGASVGQFGRVSVSGPAVLDGTLEATLSGGFTPAVGNNFPVLTYSSRTGQFANYSGLTISPTVSLQPTPNPTNFTLTTVTSTTVAPDLRVVNPTVSPSAPQSGRQVTVSWNVLNAGNSPTAASWTDRVVIVNTTSGQTVSTGDVQYNAAVRGNLLAGASAIQSYTFTLPDGPNGVGAFQTQIATDVNNTVAEFYPGNVGESNNSASVAFTSTLASNPDLQVSELAFATSPVLTGQDATVSWRVVNSGAASTIGNWVDFVTVVNVETGQTIASGSVPYDAAANGAVGPGNSSSARLFSFRVPDGTAGLGELRVTVTTDATGQIIESNPAGTGESNNVATASMTSTLGPYPDLLVASVNAPPTGAFGSQLSLTWTVQNLGTAPLVSATFERVYLSLDGTLDASDRLLATVSASPFLPVTVGGGYVNSATIALPIDVQLPAGEYRIIVVADALSQQFELSEANNVAASAPVVLTLPAGPDLIVSDIATVVEVISGQSITVTWTLTNQGSGTANGPWHDQLLYSTDDVIGSDVSLGTFTFTGTLAPGASITRIQTVAFPNGVSGQVRLVVQADISNDVLEPDGESNNAAIDDQPLTVIAPATPNLVVASISSLPTAFSGQSISVEWVVANVGLGSTNAFGWSDRVYLSLDSVIDANDIVLGERLNASYLNPGDSYRNTLTAVLPQGISNSYRIIVVADIGNNVPEPGAENDNSLVSSAITVSLTPPPDLFVSAVSSAPSQVFAGQQLQVGWTVVNQGTGATLAAAWTDQVFVSLNGDQLDGADILLASVPHSGALTIGESYSVAGLLVTLPLGMSSDNAFIIIRTDSGNQVFEHVFEANNTTARAQGISAVPPPDLAVTSLSAPGMAAAGQPLTVAYSVTNEGASATIATTWTDSIYLSPIPGLDLANAILLGNRSRTGRLEPGQSESRNYTFTLSNTLSGTFYVIVVADSNNQVAESSEANNLRATSNSTFVVYAPPDLAVTAFTVNSSPLSGQDLSVSYTVVNQGTTPTPIAAWTDAVYLSTNSTLDGGDFRLTQPTRGGVLAPGQSQSLTLSFRLPADRFGAFYLILASDSTNAVFELNESNNTSAVPITIANNQPDLAIQSFVPHLGSGPVLVGASLSFDFSVRNQGAGGVVATSWTDRLILSTDDIVGNADDVVLGSYAGVGTLASGASYARTSSPFSIPLATPAGTYRIFLQVDAGNAILELSESNNSSASFPITITTAPPGGFTVSDLQVTSLTAPQTTASGAILPVSWTVSNFGQASTSASSWIDRVWLSNDQFIDASDIQLGSFTRSSPLNPGESYSRSESFTINIDLSGQYWVIVQTDAGNAVFEGTAESNNQRVNSPSTTISLSATADLQVQLVEPPPEFYAGRQVTLSWTVANLGGATASGSWNDSVYLSLDQVFDPASDISLGYATRSSPVTASGQYTAHATLDVPAGLGGRYYVFVTTDSTNRVYERNAETNNVAYAPQSVSVIYLPPADLIVGEITVPTNGAPGQNATITYTVTNNSPNPATGTWTDSIYISADNTWDIGDALFARVTHSGPLAGGASYSETATAPLPGIRPGNYHIIVRTDIRNNIAEANESNNVGGSLDSFVVDAPALSLGTSQGGSLASARSVYYKVDVAANETLVIEFNGQSSTGFAELYASFGAVPSRASADFNSITPFQTSQRITIPVTRAGTYYIMAYGTDVPSESLQFNITARTVNFTVLDDHFGSIGVTVVNDFRPLSLNPGEDLSNRNTLRINGARFTGLTTASLIRNGQIYEATNYWLADSTTLYATFDLPNIVQLFGPVGGGGSDLGTADLRVSDPAGGTITVPNSVNVIRNTRNDGRILARFDGASSVQINGTYPVNVQVGNDSTADTYAPLITLSSERVGTPFGTSPNNLAVQTIQFLGIRNEGPAGIYSPGDTASFPLFFRANSTNVAIDMGVITSQDATPIDWASLKESLRPSTISTSAWDPIFQNITGSISTWGQYVIMLNENATALSQLGQRVSDLGTLWSYEVQQAMGTLGPVQTLASAVDASVVSPGLSLGLSRSFGANLADRNATGLFGRGWSTTWDTYLNVTTDGIVNILDSAGLRRQFTPVANQPGTYTAQPGDSGVLSFFNGSWQIQESSGSITGFRADGRIDYVQDVNNNRITATYTDGRLTRLAHSSGQFLDIFNNAAGRPSSVVDSAGRVTTFTYDATNTYLLSATGPDGITTSYTYQTTGSAQVQGALLSVTTAGVSQFFSYDSRGRLSTTSQNAGLNLITYTYDNAGRVNVADNLGSTSLFYDARGLLSRTQDPFGNFTTALYGDDFRISQIIDPLGQTQSFTWCSCGSLTSSTDQLGNTTRFTYDWIGQNNTIRRMTSFTDANGNVTRYTYDTRGNRTSTIYADGSIEFTNAYDAQGNPLRYTNRRGQVMQYQYNAAGQVTRQIFDDGSFIDLAYDAHGNLTTVTEPGNRITTYAYDTADRLTRVTYPEGYFLDYTYDAAGRRASMTDQTGYRTNYFYDTLGRLSRLTDTASVEVVRYTYDAGGRLLRTDKGNGTYTINTYDAAGQITSLVNYAPNGSVNSSFDYTYDALGRRTSQNTIDGRWVNSYDPMGQLTSAVFTPVPGSAVPAQNLQYAYDAVGNRIRTIENGVVTNYTANALNQYTHIGNDVLSYDLDGNLTRWASQGGSTVYGYDQQNRLLSINGPAGNNALTYSFNGAATSRTANGSTTQMVGDPAGPGFVVSESLAGSTTDTRYIYGLGLVAQGLSSAQGMFFDFDSTGSAVGLTDAAGRLASQSAYNGFGQRIYSTGTIEVSRTFGARIGIIDLGNGVSIAHGQAFSITTVRYLPGPSITLPSQSPRGVGRIFPGLLRPGAFDGTLSLAGTAAGLWANDNCTANEIAGALGVLSGGLNLGRGNLWGLALDASVDLAKIIAAANDAGNRYARAIQHPEESYLDRPPLQFPDPCNTPPPGQGAPASGSGDPRDPHHPNVTVPTSRDPNDILGPDGVGAERWISAYNPINYTIRFENDPLLANAPAQVVRITQTLDADLDPRSFRLGTFGFGGFLFQVPENRAYYATRLDLRETYGIYVDVFAGVDVAAGTVSWTFTSIDPLTGEVPIDRFIGFLPPNITRPEGDGFVTYTVRPKATAPTGSRIDALATIFFDQNAPIDTPPIFNTLDKSAPTSVATVPASTDDRRFRVRWSGADGEAGSGIVSYDVYVSRDDGPFQLWLDDTSLTNAEYTGEIGSTYSFYSIATDAVGNSEPLIDESESTIAVGARPPQLLAIGINDGLPQRSMVTSITFEFSSPVKLGRDAIRLVRIGGAPLGFAYSLSNPSGDGSTWVMSFNGTGIPGNSVTDGMYEVRVSANRITDRHGQTMFGGNQSMAFHRLFGDVDGNRSVDAFDLTSAARSLGTRVGDPDYPWWLDTDADNVIDMDDLLAIRRNLGRSIR